MVYGMSSMMVGQGATLRAAPLRAARLNHARTPPAARRRTLACQCASYELLYFDAQGAAETSRVLLAIAGVDYKDTRYKFSFEGGKPTVEAKHAEDKAAGVFAANLERLPLLRVGGVTVGGVTVGGVSVGQSKAIERYLAGAFGMMGEDAIQAAEVDAFCEHIRDVSTAFGKERGNPFAPITEEVQTKLDSWFEETLPGWYGKMETASGEDSAWLVGDSLTLADVCLYQLVSCGMMGADPRACSALSEYPKLAAVVEKVRALEQLQSWEAARPDNMF